MGLQEHQDVISGQSDNWNKTFSLRYSHQDIDLSLCNITVDFISKWIDREKNSFCTNVCGPPLSLEHLIED
jgi:hypothetical protein